MQSGINCPETKPGLNIVMPLRAPVNRGYFGEVLNHRKWVGGAETEAATAAEAKAMGEGESECGRHKSQSQCHLSLCKHKMPDRISVSMWQYMVEDIYI